MGGSLHLLVRDRRAKQEAWEVACIFSYGAICARTGDEHDYFDAAQLRDHDALEVLHWERQIRASAALRRLLGSATGAGMSRSPGPALLKSTHVDLAAVALRLRGKCRAPSGLSTSLNAQRLVGKVALITGAASGISKATAAEFIMNGARVVLVDIQDDAGRTITADLGPCASYTRCDVTDKAQVAAAVDLARGGGRTDQSTVPWDAGERKRKGKIEKNGGTHIWRGEWRTSRNGG